MPAGTWILTRVPAGAGRQGVFARVHIPEGAASAAIGDWTQLLAGGEQVGASKGASCLSGVGLTARQHSALKMPARQPWAVPCQCRAKPGLGRTTRAVAVGHRPRIGTYTARPGENGSCQRQAVRPKTACLAWSSRRTHDRAMNHPAGPSAARPVVPPDDVYRAWRCRAVHNAAAYRHAREAVGQAGPGTDCPQPLRRTRCL